MNSYEARKLALQIVANNLKDYQWTAKDIIDQASSIEHYLLNGTFDRNSNKQEISDDELSPFYIVDSVKTLPEDFDFISVDMDGKIHVDGELALKTYEEKKKNEDLIDEKLKLKLKNKKNDPISEEAYLALNDFISEVKNLPPVIHNLSKEKDFKYFVKNHLLYELNENQEIFYNFSNEKRILINYPRKSGVTTFLCLYALHYALLNPGVKIGICSNNFAQSTEIVRLIKDLYNNIDDKNKFSKLTFCSKDSIQFSNDSYIFIVSDASYVYGLGVDVFVIDNADYFPWSKSQDLLLNLFCSLKKDGNIIIGNTYDVSMPRVPEKNIVNLLKDKDGWKYIEKK